MLVIDIKNVEDLIFFDNRIKKKLSDFNNLFSQWTMGKRFPTVKFLAPKALLMFLEQVEEKHVKIIEEHFGTKIKVNPVDYHVIKNYKIPLDNLEKTLCESEGLTNNYCISRGRDHAYILFWR